VYIDAPVRAIRLLVVSAMLAGPVVFASPPAAALPLGCTPIPGAMVGMLAPGP
jgi:hypothetical protein